MTMHPIYIPFFESSLLQPAPGYTSVDKTNPLCYEEYGNYSTYDYDDDYDNFREDDEVMENLTRGQAAKQAEEDEEEDQEVY